MVLVTILQGVQLVMDPWTRAGIVSYLKGSTSEEDWKERCEEIKTARYGKLPFDWHMMTEGEGLHSRMQAIWKEKADQEAYRKRQNKK